MDLSSNLGLLGSTPVLYALLTLGVLAAVASLGVITEFFVSGHRDRVTRQESIRTYYSRELALTH